MTFSTILNVNNKNNSTQTFVYTTSKHAIFMIFYLFVYLIISFPKIHSGLKLLPKNMPNKKFDKNYFSTMVNRWQLLFLFFTFCNEFFF